MASHDAKKKEKPIHPDLRRFMVNDTFLYKSLSIERLAHNSRHILFTNHDIIPGMSVHI